MIDDNGEVEWELTNSSLWEKVWGECTWNKTATSIWTEYGFDSITVKLLAFPYGEPGSPFCAVRFCYN
jgi:hypothetical protein